MAVLTVNRIVGTMWLSLFWLPGQATRAYLHKEEDVEAALVKAGYRVAKREMTASKFYFSRLFEAVPAS